MDSDHVCRTLEKAFLVAGFPGIHVEYWGFDPDDYDCEDGLTGFYSRRQAHGVQRQEVRHSGEIGRRTPLRSARHGSYNKRYAPVLSRQVREVHVPVGQCSAVRLKSERLRVRVPPGIPLDG